MRRFGLLILIFFENGKGLKCYKCQDGKYDEDCVNEIEICQHPNAKCITEMRQENKIVRISKGCKQDTSCDQLKYGDYDTCIQDFLP